jgi:hypothetical protein
MKQFAFLAALVLLVGAGCSATTSTSVDTTDNTSPVVQEETPNTDAMDSTDDTTATQVESGTYVITTGESRYIAQKEFFSKPTEEVTGTTSDVSGTVTVDTALETVSVSATIANTFTTSANGRDKEVQKLLGGEITIQGDALSFSALQSGEVILNLTIAGKTLPIPFAVTAPLTTPLTASGSATFSIRDFGLTAPSLLNVYTVNDTIRVSFDIAEVTKQ